MSLEKFFAYKNKTEDQLRAKTKELATCRSELATVSRAGGVDLEQVEEQTVDTLKGKNSGWKSLDPAGQRKLWNKKSDQAKPIE